jgi:hypothetical protein
VFIGLDRGFSGREGRPRPIALRPRDLPSRPLGPLGTAAVSYVAIKGVFKP